MEEINFHKQILSQQSKGFVGSHKMDSKMNKKNETGNKSETMRDRTTSVKFDFHENGSIKEALFLDEN